MWDYNPYEYWRCTDPDHVCMFSEKPVDPVCYAQVIVHYCCAECGKINPYTHEGLTVCCEQPLTPVRGRCGKQLVFVRGQYPDIIYSKPLSERHKD